MAISIVPSIELSPFAKANLQKLNFGQVSFDTSPKESIDSPELNWFGRTVRTISAADSALAKLGKLVARIVLALSIVGIPLLVFYDKEKAKQKQITDKIFDAQQKVDMRVQLINKRALIVEQLGLQDFDKVPVLEVADRMGTSDCVDFLKPKDLTSSVMKGVDKINRPFIAIKVTDLNDSTKSERVFTLFQKYPDHFFQSSQGNNHLIWQYGTDFERNSSLDGKWNDLIDGSLVKKHSCSLLQKIIAGEVVGGLKLAS